MARATVDVDTLASRVRGAVRAPLDEGYDAARRNWNRAVDQRPQLVVEAVCAADVAAAVAHAHEKRLPVAVKCTGRGAVHPCDGGVLIDVGAMRDVSLDAARRRVRVDAGARWSDVLARTSRVGLAPLAGFAAGAGAVGDTLTGGLGWLLRRHGAAADTVLEAEVVTADGRIVRAAPESEPGLLDAIAGGGGNHGVVTSLDLRLVPARAVFAGGRAYPPERAHEMLRFFRDWAAWLPPEVTASFVLLRLPAGSRAPAPLPGRAMVGIHACAVTDEVTGRELMGPLATLGGAALDAFRTMPFAEIGAIGIHPHKPTAFAGHCELFSALPNRAIEALMGFVGPEAPSPYRLAELRHIGGRATPGRPGFRDRDASFLLHCTARTPTPADARAAHAYGVELGAGLAPHTTGGTSLGFIGTSNGPDAVRRAYTEERYRELARLKAVHDPDNVFRFGHNIPPEA